MLRSLLDLWVSYGEKQYFPDFVENVSLYGVMQVEHPGIWKWLYRLFQL